MARAHRTSYTVSYESEDHWRVLTQLWGSKWPEVLPYCIFAVLLMIALHILDQYHKVIEISKQGHAFLTFVVAFLLVSRVAKALARYNSSRDSLGVMYRESRELIQAMCVVSNDIPKSAPWRHEVAYRTLLLLRTCMAVIDYPTDNVTAWSVPEMNGEEKTFVLSNLYKGTDRQRWGHFEVTDWEESMRVPILLEYLLKKTIHGQTETLDPAIPVVFENRLLGSVSGFMGGYYGIRTFLTTPIPFPLIQMARTFLFLYVFTVPLVLLQDNSTLLAHCAMIFVMVFGFVGLELVAIELDNPFGDDANDFNNMALAEVAFEDTYLTILDVDGPEWADKLRQRMHDPNKTDLAPEQAWLMSPQ